MSAVSSVSVPGDDASGGVPYGQALFDRMLSDHICPEIARRQGEGTIGDDVVLVRFQVLFPRGAATQVRLNSEVGGTVVARALREVAAGEQVTIEDTGEISAYTPRAEDEGVPHVTAFLHAEGWSVVFDFGDPGHPDRLAFFERANEFFATACESLSAGRIGAFLDNALSAAELLAKAELLSATPTIDLVLGSSKHRHIHMPYHAWVNLGNADRAFGRILRQLTELRRPARYLDRDLTISADDSEELRVVLERMRDHVRGVVGAGEPGARPDVIYVYATRRIQAGEPIFRSDTTLFPRKSAIEAAPPPEDDDPPTESEPLEAPR